MNMAIENAFDSNVLDEKFHTRLVRDLDKIAGEANIPVSMVMRTMRDYCTEEEVEWVKHIRNREGEQVGLAYVGDSSSLPIETRMMAMAGTCLRNHIDARLYTVQEVLKRLGNNTMPDPSVLLIPNFFISKEQGGHISSWLISSLLGLLINRLAAGKATVLYIDNLKQLESEYGKAFVQHIHTYFTLIV